MTQNCRCTTTLLATALLTLGVVERSTAQLCVQLNGAHYTQNFNSLPATGTSNLQSTIPIGFAFSESGAGNNVTFAAGDGSSSTNNTYSFGSTGNSDRAFGELGDTLQSTLGACFVNNTGLTIQSFSIGYTGEQWRLGAADGNTADKLDFQFSTTATALNTGTYTDVNTLDFVSPTLDGPVGALNGNAAANRSAKSPTAIIPPGGIPQGSTFFIRWVPSNITGNDDGLAIDDFSIGINPTADFDLDGDVDGVDFLRWQRGNGLQSGASISVGDGNKDGAVDLLDLALWRKFFAGPPFAEEGATGAAPEPASLVLISVVAASLGVARRRRHSGSVGL